MNRIIEQRLADHLNVLQKLMNSDLPEKLETCAKYVEKALAEGHKVLFCGNGGRYLYLDGGGQRLRV